MHRPCLENRQVLESRRPSSGNRTGLGRDGAQGGAGGAGCSSSHEAGFRPRREPGPYLHSIRLDTLGQQLHFLLSFNVCTVPCPGTGKPQSDLLYLSKQWLPLGTQRNSSETLEKARKVYLVVYDAREPNTGTLVTE